jgi:hypothetical protein
MGIFGEPRCEPAQAARMAVAPFALDPTAKYFIVETSQVGCDDAIRAWGVLCFSAARSRLS